jgi:transcriptional regulator with XRE-family HTH domain
MLTAFGAALIFGPRAAGPPNREIRSCTSIAAMKPRYVGKRKSIRWMQPTIRGSTMPGMAKQQLPSEMKVLAGLRLRAARLVLGIQSEKQMAEDLGVTSNAYSNYELGVRLVDVSMAVRLLELTGIGPDWIYAGSTTGVPFDRARSLQAHLQQLKQSAPASPPSRGRGRGKSTPPRSTGSDPPPPFVMGGHVAKNQDLPDCEKNVTALRHRSITPVKRR